VLLSCLSGGPPASAATGTPLAGYARTGNGVGYLYDSAGGPVSVVKVFKGVYDVDFYGLAKLGEVDTNEQVTAFGSKVACQDGGQVMTPDYFGEQINCYTSAGAPVNALFDLSVTHVQTRPHGFYDYATDVWPGQSRDLAESSSYELCYFWPRSLITRSRYCHQSQHHAHATPRAPTSLALGCSSRNT
jgi:hypothetical protein